VYETRLARASYLPPPRTVAGLYQSQRDCACEAQGWLSPFGANPGCDGDWIANPKRGCDRSLFARARISPSKRAQPFQGCTIIIHLFPGLELKSALQPWALWRNPFGIRSGLLELR
jgi:hypothetical protein